MPPSSPRSSFILAAMALCLRFPAAEGAPPNDSFSAPEPLAGDSGQTAGSNVGATAEPGEPAHAGDAGGHSAWWTWQPSGNGLATVYTYGSSFDTLLAVYTGGSLPDLEEVASNDDISDEAFLSLVTFAVSAGTSYHVAVDGFEGAAGRIVLTWHLDGEGSVAPNDAFASAESLPGDSGLVMTSSRGATREPGEPAHAPRAGSGSLWWRWIPSIRGVATVHLSGSSFDAWIAVYRGAGIGDLTLLTADDDSGQSFAPQVIFPAEAGVEYRIAVDGNDPVSSVVLLSWSLAPACDGPEPPSGPLPADGEPAAPAAPRLEWDRAFRIRRAVIYGDDDRREFYEVTDPLALAAWESTVAVVRASSLTDNGDGTFSLPAKTLGESLNLCEGEPFREQPNPALCSGFLVSPDLVATAGRCIANDSDCALVAFVFGFRMTSPAEPVLVFPASQVYHCAGLVGNRLPNDPADWAVVRLDRPVPDRVPLRIRRQGRVPDLQALLVIGHPGGLPGKLAGNARVRDNAGAGFFLTNLDAFIGSAGSAVFNAGTLDVEAVLLGGEEDLEDVGDCYRAERCSDVGCSGEAAARVTELAHLVPPSPESRVYKVHFGACGGMALLGETRDGSWELGPLEPGTYCWQVVAADECGETPGPVWSFTSGGAPSVPFQRGDAIDDGLLNLSDAVSVLNHLFQGGEPPLCRKSADVDDNGEVNITDPIALLGYLFLSGTPPASPLEACGFDPSPDELSCLSYAACAP